eukprot:5345647-Pyramimonas_sp.AAC.1
MGRQPGRALRRGKQREAPRLPLRSTEEGGGRELPASNVSLPLRLARRSRVEAGPALTQGTT